MGFVLDEEDSLDSGSHDTEVIEVLGGILGDWGWEIEDDEVGVG